MGQVTHASSEACCACLAPRVDVDHMISTGGSKLLVIVPGHTAYTACSKTHLEKSYNVITNITDNIS